MNMRFLLTLKVKYKRNSMIQKLSILVILVFFLLSGCHNKGTQQEQLSDDTLIGFDETEEIKEVYYRFPSPDEMLNFINREQIRFNDDYLHSADRAGSYLDSKSEALNLGVYIADLAFVTLFERQKEAYSYIQVIYGLSDKLRISAAFDPAKAKQFEENLGNIDSLKALADEALDDITHYLVREDKERVLAVISIGGFVESLYLAFQVVDEYTEDNLIIQRISDQKLVLENLLNYSLEYAGDKNVSDAINMIHPIRAVYNEMVSSVEETKVDKDQNGKLVISGGEKIHISEAQYMKLRNATFDVREKIVENLEN
jgi:hypothetical protein